MKSDEKYSDIIDLPHPEPKYHHRMSVMDRAAQFSPFAALTGHDAALREKARLTSEKLDLDEDALDELDRRLQLLEEWQDEQHSICVTFFQKDSKKDGGEYQTCSGSVMKIDRLEQQLLMDDGTLIDIDAISAIEGRIFDLADGIQN